jgi:type IV pilus assembly protein PilC
MPSFKYQVEGPGGQISTGELRAGNLMDASAVLRARGDTVLNVALADEAPTVLERMRGIRVELGPGLKDVHSFTKQLAVMIKAGIDIRSALEGTTEQIENPKFRAILQQVRMDVESGEPFSEALAKHPKVFDALYVNMVRASELSGNFGKMLERIANYLSQQIETRSMVRGAMIYPCIIAFMAVVTTVFLLTFVLPRFTALFAGKEDLLPKPTKFLIALSGFMRSRWYVIVGAVVAMGVAFRMFIKTPSGRIKWDRFKLRVPLIKRMLRALYITRGLQTMGELITAGVPMLDVLNITADVSGNKVYSDVWDEVGKAVKEGEKIATPLYKGQVLPKNVVQMIAAGEESGNLGDVMVDISEFYASELKNTIKAVTGMIEPLMIMIMGVVVGFIAMSIILPIFKMSSLVK